MYRPIAVEKIYVKRNPKAPVWKRIARWFAASSNSRPHPVIEPDRIHPGEKIFKEINSRIGIERAESSARRIMR